jgi:branched-chain amino acid transport system substrate-binding protein
MVHRPAGQSGRSRQLEAVQPFAYHFFWGLEDIIAVFTSMWGQIDTNKKVAGLFPNDGDGNAWGDKGVGFPPVLDKLGYSLTDPGRYQNMTDDFSAQIGAFKAAQCEISHRRDDTARLHHLLTQAKQQGFNPKIASSARRCCFRRRSRHSVITATICRPRSGGRRAIHSARR